MPSSTHIQIDKQFNCFEITVHLIEVLNVGIIITACFPGDVISLLQIFNDNIVPNKI